MASCVTQCLQHKEREAHGGFQPHPMRYLALVLHSHQCSQHPCPDSSVHCWQQLAAEQSGLLTRTALAVLQVSVLLLLLQPGVLADDALNADPAAVAAEVPAAVQEQLVEDQERVWQPSLLAGDGNCCCCCEDVATLGDA